MGGRFPIGPRMCWSAHVSSAITVEVASEKIVIDLLSVDRKREQHVAWCSTGGRVARVDVDDAVGDDWSWPVDRAAAAQHTVDGFVNVDRVHVPDNFAVGGRVRAHVAVH